VALTEKKTIAICYMSRLLNSIFGEGIEKGKGREGGKRGRERIKREARNGRKKNRRGGRKGKGLLQKLAQGSARGKAGSYEGPIIDGKLHCGSSNF